MCTNVRKEVIYENSEPIKAIVIFIQTFSMSFRIYMLRKKLHCE